MQCGHMTQMVEINRSSTFKVMEYLTHVLRVTGTGNLIYWIYQHCPRARKSTISFNPEAHGFKSSSGKRLETHHY